MRVCDEWVCEEVTYHREIQGIAAMHELASDGEHANPGVRRDALRVARKIGALQIINRDNGML